MEEADDALFGRINGRLKWLNFHAHTSDNEREWTDIEKDMLEGFFDTKFQNRNLCESCDRDWDECCVSRYAHHVHEIAECRFYKKSVFHDMRMPEGVSQSKGDRRLP